MPVAKEIFEDVLECTECELSKDVSPHSNTVNRYLQATQLPAYG